MRWRCPGSWMAVTVPNHEPMECPECRKMVAVEDDGTERGYDQLAAHDTEGRPWDARPVSRQ